MKEIKHQKANVFREYNDNIEKLLENELKQHGQKFTHALPVREIIDCIKRTENWELKLISLSHDYDISVDKHISRFYHPSEGKQTIFDRVSSNISSDDYFTHSHQRKLGIIVSLGAAIMSSIWHDNDLFPDCIQWYNLFLIFISKHMGENVNLAEDLESLYVMLQPVILSDELAFFFFCTVGDKKLGMNYRNSIAH
ncbi:MAG: hypothetical protein HFG49_14175 [Lachnospiraceae bacterium]|jgi:hypothetical protein|nr:hypothetical protein [Lachnospiraceae bacterium]